MVCTKQAVCRQQTPRLKNTGVRYLNVEECISLVRVPKSEKCLVAFRLAPPWSIQYATGGRPVETSVAFPANPSKLLKEQLRRM